MTTKSVSIKWGQKQYESTVEEAMTCKAFMEMVADMTGVPVDNMKIMGLSGILKPSDATLQSKGLKNNHKIMMIGHLPSKTINTPSGPETKFVEDLTKEERMKLFNESERKPLPVGINNLGVTCYLNSCIQAITAIKPVKEAIVEFGKDRPAAALGVINDESITSDIAKLLVDLEGGTEAPTPMKLVASMRSKFPELARKAQDSNGFMQQDVDEFWHYLNQIFDHKKFASGENPLRAAFTFQMKTVTELDTTHPDQTNLDPSKVEKKIDVESFMKMSAFMGSATNPITLVQQAMKLALVTTLKKRAPELGDKEYQFRSVSKLMSLPNYLNLHFVRFEWKRNDEGGTRAKVTRRIGFSQTLDLFDFCDEDLQMSLRPARNAGALDVTPKKPEVGKTGDESMEPENDPMVSYPDGTYKLVAIITHQGRTADSGHYVCWRKKNVDDVPKDRKEDRMWIQFDDDKVTESPWDSIDLQGGRGDYHMAYLTFWKQNLITVKKSQYDATKADCDERQKQLQEALGRKAANETKDTPIDED